MSRWSLDDDDPQYDERMARAILPDDDIKKDVA